MAAGSKWIVPSFTRGEVDRAGRLLVQNGVADALAVGHALDVINNWRSSHSFPLDSFQVTLRKRASSICGHPLVAQRLKRVPSIFGKLQRFPAMKFVPHAGHRGCAGGATGHRRRRPPAGSL